jgi:Domain of unknown function (DUF4214)
MKKALTAGLAIALASFVSQPAQAVTPQEALGIGIGVTALTCALSNGCNTQPVNYYRHRNYRPHYRQYSAPVYVVPVVPVRPRYYQPNYNYQYDRYDRNDSYYDNRSYNPSVSYRRTQDVSGSINVLYLEVLGRNADYQGLRTYQDRYNSGWSIDDIRRDLVRSDEARNRYYR